MTTMKKINDEEYFSIPALSNSFLCAFDVSPAHAFTGWEKTKSMEMGTALHCATLEPEIFEKKYAVSDLNRATNEYKNLLKDNPGVEFLKKSEMINCVEARNSIYNYNFEGQKLGDIIERSQKEIAVFFRLYGMDCKAKLDIYYDHFSNTIFDLKKTQDALDFRKSVINYQYYRQAYFYKVAIRELTGSEPRFIFIPVELSEPYGVRAVELDSEYVEAGNIATAITIQKYKNWVESGSDKSIKYEETTEKLYRPEWLMKDYFK